MKNCVFTLAVSLFVSGLLGCLLMIDSKPHRDEFLMMNIEALSQVEHGQYVKCYDQIKYDPIDQERYCMTCTELPCTFKTGMNFCIPQ